MFRDLVDWSATGHPHCSEAWEEMAICGLARVRSYQAGMCSATDVAAAMRDTATWVGRRGRHGERTDAVVLRDDLDLLPAVYVEPYSSPCPQRIEPAVFLEEAVGCPLPSGAIRQIDQAWRIALRHFARLAEATGLEGAELLEAGQSNETVNPSRRLSNQLPGAWPPAARKAAVQLLAGRSTDPGLILLWATSTPQAVPAPLRDRWRGLVAVMDPRVGRLPDAERRRVRDQARRWAGTTAEPADVAV